MWYYVFWFKFFIKWISEIFMDKLIVCNLAWLGLHNRNSCCLIPFLIKLPQNDCVATFNDKKHEKKFKLLLYWSRWKRSFTPKFPSILKLLVGYIFRSATFHLRILEWFAWVPKSSTANMADYMIRDNRYSFISLGFQPYTYV